MFPTAQSLGISVKKSSLAGVPSGAGGKSLSKSNSTSRPSSQPVIASLAKRSIIFHVTFPDSTCVLTSLSPPL